MPRINLLPIKAQQKRLTAKNEMLGMIVLILATIAGLYFWYDSMESKISDYEAKLEKMKTIIGSLSKDEEKVIVLKKKKTKAKKKLEVINSLTRRNAGPARMLHELAMIMTRESKRVWLTSLSESGGTLRLSGGAMEHEDVSEFQLALERRDMFSKVELKRVTVTKDADVKFLKWELVCNAKTG